MVTRRKLGQAIDRQRVLRVMREHELIQRRGRAPRRRRPGAFRVTRPAELWHMDVTRLGRQQSSLPRFSLSSSTTSLKSIQLPQVIGSIASDLSRAIGSESTVTTTGSFDAVPLAEVMRRLEEESGVVRAPERNARPSNQRGTSSAERAP